jgi:glycosyltransferase involved in cell wall biosynthesis
MIAPRRSGIRSVTFFNRFYWPDVAATGQLLTDLAEDLAAAGWSVRVVTGRTTYLGQDGLASRREIRAGVEIVRVRGTRFGRRTLLGRAADYASYAVAAFVEALRSERGSVLVGMTDPPMFMSGVLLAARVRGCRAVYWAQDVFPDVAVRLGVLRGGGIPHRLLRAIAGAVCRHCDAVVALGERMADLLVRAGVSSSSVAVIHNWADTTAIVPVAREQNSFRVEQGIRDEFLVLYSGNMGRAHTFDALKGAMLRLRSEPILFMFVGSGYRLGELTEFARAYALSNVRFLDYLPRRELANSLPAADVAVVTEDPTAVGLLVPSKTYGVLASGRPLLFVGSQESDVAGIVRESDCGFVISPSDAAGVSEAILQLQNDPDIRRKLGANARQAAESRYSRAGASRAWDELLEAVLAARTGAVPLMPGSAYSRPAAGQETRR